MGLCTACVIPDAAGEDEWWEGWRLHALSTQMVAGAVVGDDTFPDIVGAALLLLGRL